MKKQPTPYARICQFCGLDYRAQKPTSKYCSMRCRAWHSNKLSPAQRLWSQTAWTGECLEWTGLVTHAGYGTLPVYGYQYFAHRLAWQLTCGVIPAGLSVLHKCDNPPCVYPDHLFLGTQKDNMADCARKGRIARQQGERSPAARLTNAQVLAIRNDHRSRKAIAADYNVGPTCIFSIQHYQSWKHLP
jgi:hypothetical protein